MGLATGGLLCRAGRLGQVEVRLLDVDAGLCHRATQ